MNRKFIHSGRGNVRIRGGKVLPIILAKHTCVCLECLAPLQDKTNGLVCSENETHRGIVTKKEAEKTIAPEQAEQVEAIEANYQIMDGQLVPISEPLGE